MSIAKVAISIDEKQLKKIEEPLEHGSLAKECAKLDVHFEQEMADIGLDEDWSSSNQL
jgi:hypothetical protein